jgi:hypothetical protein
MPSFGNLSSFSDDYDYIFSTNKSLKSYKGNPPRLDAVEAPLRREGIILALSSGSCPYYLHSQPII